MSSIRGFGRWRGLEPGGPETRPYPEFRWVDAEGPADAELLDQPRPELRLESRLESEAAGLESRLESPLAAIVLALLAQSARGKADLAQALGHATVSGELHKQIKRLKDLNLIEPTLPDRTNSRLQQYRLTAAGRELIANGGTHKGRT